MFKLNSNATVAQAISWAQQQFANTDIYYGHGTDNPLDEACYLVLVSLGLAFDCHEEMLQQSLSTQQQQLIRERVRQRIESRTPVAYLVNQAWFAGRPFYVNEHVLIPRSPIAELINAAFAPWLTQQKVTRILDIGTGSACIAIACAFAFPQARVDAVEIEAEAMKVAQRNVCDYQLEARVKVIASDVFSALGGQRYDIIVSNPPYVAQTEYQTLPAEYTHEPAAALVAEDNGMQIVRCILQQAGAYLHEDGILIVEVGNTQQAVISEYPGLPFVWLEFAHGGDGVFLLNKSALAE